ncbi:hypothetical protein FRB93_010189 [Tulasnella sp. JGI-2019a]|nr:hypothetical protein FRB93_010189 [Tulasnella sp. JGI-2019a]
MSATAPPPLAIDKHVAYIKALGKNTQDLQYHFTAHLRLNAIYWGLTALWIMGQPDALNKEELLQFVMSCWDDETGAFGAHPQHDAHILSTLSGIQILVMHDALDRLDVARVTSFILGLQNPNGSFSGDRFGETDTRFLYCSVSALSLLGKLDLLDIDKTVGHIVRCRNFDGGFGTSEGAETHAGQIFVCTAALAILGRLEAEVDQDTVGWWLAERQLPNGGLNGRPEKLEDVSSLVHESESRKGRTLNPVCCPYPYKVCYSFWVLSSLSILRKLHWIDDEALTRFVLSAQVGSPHNFRLPHSFYPSFTYLLLLLRSLTGHGSWWYCGQTGRHGRCLPYSIWRGWTLFDGISRFARPRSGLLHAGGHH